MTRCSWVGHDPVMIKYHDEEWGVPVHDDRKLFEFFVLDTFQAGLSWAIILKKRSGLAAAFANFDAEKVASFGEAEVERLLQDANIIRNRQKIVATINNAQRFLEVQGEFGSFDSYIWGFTKGKTIQNSWIADSSVPAKTELAEQVSRDLIKRGFKFVGPTIIYAFMQGAGIINDHLVNCFRYRQLYK